MNDHFTGHAGLHFDFGSNNDKVVVGETLSWKFFCRLVSQVSSFNVLCILNSECCIYIPRNECLWFSKPFLENRTTPEPQTNCSLIQHWMAKVLPFLFKKCTRFSSMLYNWHKQFNSSSWSTLSKVRTIQTFTDYLLTNKFSCGNWEVPLHK